MPKIEISNAKGLVQKTGTGVVAVPNPDLGVSGLQTLADGDVDKEIKIRTTGGSDSFAVRIATAGALSTTRTIQSPVGGANDKGRLLLLINETTEPTHTIKITSLGGDLKGGASLLLVWTGTAWSTTSQTLA